jgi:PIN domain nuclease of toxin-antitoxin system
MRILLDTHIFLWYISSDPKLPVNIHSRISDPENDVFLSVVSIWEAIVKHQLGKLPLPHSAAIYLPKQRERHMIASLDLDEQSLMKLDTLPLLHRDPFDRMLISQALQHQLVIATVDDAIREYPVSLL